ncbi:ribonuclease 3-like protein 2, partial [Quercus suber]
ELPSYERLEYVGDAVLNLLFTKEHYSLYPNLSPGPLTRLRAANVDTDKLARVAIRHGLHRYLRHKKPLLGEQPFQQRLVKFKSVTCNASSSPYIINSSKLFKNYRF